MDVCGFHSVQIYPCVHVRAHGWMHGWRDGYDMVWDGWMHVGRHACMWDMRMDVMNERGMMHRWTWQERDGWTGVSGVNGVNGINPCVNQWSRSMKSIMESIRETISGVNRVDGVNQ